MGCLAVWVVVSAGQKSTEENRFLWEQGLSPHVYIGLSPALNDIVHELNFPVTAMPNYIPLSASSLIILQ
jgi:hypothetical protein